MVVKSKTIDTLIADLTKVFKALKVYRWKLNPTKCIFGVPSSILQGNIISHRGIEANPEKIAAVTNMKQPTYVKDIQKLMWCMATLSHFISRLGKKGLPFFKLLKAQEKFVWSEDANKAQAVPHHTFDHDRPQKDKTLLIYIAATNRVVSTTIVVERGDAKHAYKV